MGSRELIALLEAAGWQHVRTTGSHHHYKHPDNPLLVTVKHPQKDVPKGTLNAILKKAGLKP